MDTNKFLYTLSGLGGMSVGQLMDSFNSLCVDSCDEDYNLKLVVLNYLRKLCALGHIEYEGLGRDKMIYPCRPYLVTIHADPICAVLCGARSTILISEITNFAKKVDEIEVQFVNQPPECVRAGSKVLYLYPDAIYIKGSSPQDIGKFAKKFGISYDERSKKSIEIAEYSGSLEEYKSNLNWDKYSTDDIDEARKRGFSTERLKFDEKLSHSSCLVEYQFNKWDYEVWFWDNGRGSKVETSWGRFMALKANNKNIIFYCKNAQWYAVPSSTPLPVLLGRALSVRSGIVPYNIRTGDLSKYGIESNNIFYDVYFMVPPKLAKIVSEKVGQKYIPVGIGNEEETICLI